MKSGTKLLALAAIAVIGVGAAAVYSSKTHPSVDTVTLTEWITPATFFKVRDFMERSTASKKRVIAHNSFGGNWEAALAIGTLIHRHGWDVEVEGFCASSCANFIFPAGKKKYLHGDSLLIFHGGPHQANLLDQLAALEQGSAQAAVHAATEVKQSARQLEGRLEYDPQNADARRRIREFLSLPDAQTDRELFDQLVEASDRFYAELGVNIELPTYGQKGRYEPVYQQQKYGGFFYRLDSLRRLGLSHIEVLGGEWHPERHPDFADLYEVAYP